MTDDIENSNHNNHISMNNLTRTSKTNGTMTHPGGEHKQMSLVEHYRNSSYYKNMKKNCECVLGSKAAGAGKELGVADYASNTEYQTSFPVQVSILKIVFK